MRYSTPITITFRLAADEIIVLFTIVLFFTGIPATTPFVYFFSSSLACCKTSCANYLYRHQKRRRPQRPIPRLRAFVERSGGDLFSR